MIIIHIGLPKTASTKLLSYIRQHTDIITTFWMERYIHNTFKDFEMSMPDALKFNYKLLLHNKNYFIKSPLFINDKKLTELLKIINQSGHEVKLILGVRNIIDASYSLYKHWSIRGELKSTDCSCVLDVYNKHLSYFFSNIDTHIASLKNYNTIIYNVDNYKGNWYSFLSEIFRLLEIKVDIKKSLPDEKFQISQHSDIDNLEKNIKNITNIKYIYNNYFEGKTIFKI